MSLSAEERSLLHVSKAAHGVLKYFKQGVYLQSSTGRTIEQLHEQASVDRMRLASGFLATGDRLVRGRPPMFRVAVGRYYYAMYHAMRAVVYFHIVGDDHEKHSDLPSWTPADFPRVDYWKNELKDARLRRNEADYDPYPTNDVEFRRVALEVRKSARELYEEARQYLAQKGCTLT
jgi:uncharacterized protein (UPF0332 family)